MEKNELIQFMKTRLLSRRTETIPNWQPWPSEEVNRILDIIKARPWLAKERDKEDGSTPLHWAMYSRAPVKVVAALLDAHPKAAIKVNSSGFTPLHTGLERCAPSDSIQLLIRSNPHIVKSRPSISDRSFFPNLAVSSSRRTFLHLGMYQGASIGVIHALLQTYPKAAKIRDKHGRTPLHAGVMGKASAETISAVLQAYPRGVEITDDNNMTPLHHAMNCFCAPDKIAVILNVYPRALGLQEGRNGSTPIHLGVMSGAPLDTIQFCLEKYPEAAEIKDREGRTPLHCLMQMKDATASAIKALLEAYPGAAVITDNLGRTPLYVGMENDVSVDALSILVKMSPQSATKFPLPKGQTPLHWFMEKGAPAEIASMIMNIFPGSVALPDESGKTALHMAMHKNTSVEAVTIILRARPGSAELMDNRGQTPLAVGIANGAPDSAIKAILEFCPTAPGMNLKCGLTPLHWAMEKGVSDTTIQAMLDEHPKAAGMVSDFGQTPLHLGMVNGATVTCIKALLKACPTGVLLTDYNGQTALHLGIKHNSSLATIKCILEACPEAAKVKDRSGQTPLHQMTSAEVIEAVLKTCPEAAEIRDGNGLPPLHLAVVERAPQECIESFLKVVPDAAKLKDEKNDCTPLHFAIEEENMDAVKVILKSKPATAKMRDKHGRTPLFCLMNLFYKHKVQGKSIDHIHDNVPMWKDLFEAYPEAADVDNNAGMSPVNFLVGRCSRAITFDSIVEDGTLLYLHVLLKSIRDGRPLKKLCKLQNPIALQAFFLIFDEQSVCCEKSEIPHINLNQDIIAGWTALEILADLDNQDASNVLFQVIENQQAKSTKKNKDGLITITCQDASNTVISFYSTETLTDETMRKLADRAKLSNSSEWLKKWGEEYGRFLGKYLIDKYDDPKHRSATCVVVFGTELRVMKDGRKHEKRVALKFISDAEAFAQEINQRQVIAENAKKDDVVGEYVMPIRAAYTADSNALMGGKKLPGVIFREDFTKELSKYKNVQLNAGPDNQRCKELRYVLIMDCGSGLDLSDIISHQNIAGENILIMLDIAIKIAECLQFLNEICGIIHGDVKARNFIFLGVGSGYAAIDLDNAASIKGGEYMGKKRTSSGYLPPEQAAFELKLRLEDDGLANIESLENLQRRLNILESRIMSTPRAGNLDDLGILLVERKELEGRLRHHRNASRTAPVKASIKYDMWCFGVLLFYLCTGQQLFNMDTREEVSNSELRRIRDWNKGQTFAMLQRISLGWPKSLLADLLQTDPCKRPDSWSFIVDKLNSFKSAPNERKAETISCPCMWSISYHQLIKFSETASIKFGPRYPTMTMRDISEAIIKPCCQENETSYALLLNPEGLMIDAFITHSWDEPFDAFVTSIRKVFQTTVKKPNLWICAFALVQGDHKRIKQQLGSKDVSLNESPFVKALERASTFVVVRNKSTDLYSRIWCVCELIYAVKLDLVPNKTHVTGPDVFSDLRTSCVDAKSTNLEDKERILEVLMIEHDVKEIDGIVNTFRSQNAPE